MGGVLQQVTPQRRGWLPLPRRRGRPRMARRRRRPVLRFVAAVMTTSGLLLLADAGLTLAWQEPVSAVLAARDQSRLEDQLGELPVPDFPAQGLSDSELERLARRHADRVGTGDAWGRIELPRLDADYVVVEGTDPDSLRAGPGHYPDTGFPGEGGTVAIAGHRTTYLAPFNDIDVLEEGDELVLELPYARFTYAVEQQKIVDPSQTSVTRDTKRGERLVLSACHPLYSAAERIIVFADLEDVEPA